MKKPESRFFVALAFLLWSLLPHFQFIVHTHAGDGTGHKHATMSKAQIRLADQAAMALTAAGEVLDPELFAGEDRPSGDFPSGLASITKARNSSAHSHIHDDINVSGMANPPHPIASGVQPAVIAPSLYCKPDLTVRNPFPARGPPAFLPA